MNKFITMSIIRFKKIITKKNAPNNVLGAFLILKKDTKIS